MRVVVGLSGGVDSAVAAGLLKEKGYEVIGITLRLVDEERELTQRSVRGCCGSEAVASARRVAAVIGIPFYVRDLRKEFSQLVIENFFKEYANGRTPNPCIRCNQLIKFPLLLKLARQLKADFVATGHYAQIGKDEKGGWHLYKGVDTKKDQSYFLYILNQETLAWLLFPVGGFTKQEVREWAKRLGLPNAERSESQDFCANFIKKHRPELFRPGPVYSPEGDLIGEHQGIAYFTLGQRRGLGVAFGERRYVVRIDRERNAIILGKEGDVYHRIVEVEDVHWVLGKPPGQVFKCFSKVRYQGPGGFAEVEVLPKNRVRVVFETPQWAPTPGQAIVFWDGDEVLGGGIIER